MYVPTEKDKHVCSYIYEKMSNLKKVRMFDETCKKQLLRQNLPDSDCHNISVACALHDKKYKLYSGIAAIDNEEFVPHSWCLRNGILIECTPLIRTIYYGVKVTPDELMEAFEEHNK